MLRSSPFFVYDFFTKDALETNFPKPDNAECPSGIDRLTDGRAFYNPQRMQRNFAVILAKTLLYRRIATRLPYVDPYVDKEDTMRTLLRTTSLLAVLAIPLFLTNPVLAADAPTQKAEQTDQAPGQGDGQPPMMRGGAMMGPRGGMNGGMKNGRMGDMNGEMMCGCPRMMGRPDGMMADKEARGPMPPKGPETPEMTRLREQMETMRKKFEADREQVRLDCEQMRDLHHKMFEEMRKNKPRQHRRQASRGNAAPANPALEKNEQAPSPAPSAP